MSIYKSAKKGRFIPKNPGKWAQKNIIFRSGIERRYFNYFDLNSNILKIASEQIVIPYYDPVKGKKRKYYVDIIIKYRTKDGDIKVKLVEIKSSSEARPPKKSKNRVAYERKMLTWLTNKAKWDAASQWAKRKNVEFVVLTERDIQ